ncbi:MAG: hypothetical protein J6R06_08330 [Bacteroidales bacterium]|nr:hypothetical protein [Bacteroidales bacterium]
MSNNLFNDSAPFDYQTQNYYNANRSPSTIHTKNTKIRRYFRKYLLQKAISVFDWKIPEEWDKDYFLYTLYGLGYIAVIHTEKYGVICQGGALGGYNIYYRPSYIIITNPLLQGSITATIDKETAIIKLQPDYSSIMDIVGFYADQLALASESLGVNLVNVKTGIVFGAESKAQAESYKKMFDNLSSGDPATVIDKKLLNDNGEPTWFPFVQNVKQSYVASDIISDMRKIESMFDTEIGIPNANTDKAERLITDEVNANNVETASRCELWLDCLRKGLTKANDMFNLKLAVDWRVKPDYGLNRPKSIPEQEG